MRTKHDYEGKTFSSSQKIQDGFYGETVKAAKHFRKASQQREVRGNVENASILILI